MKITNEKYKNLNLANEEDRGENLSLDFIISSILGIAIAYFTFKSYGIAFLIYLLVRFIYYLSFELFYGRTPGKYQTQTQVVNKKGEKSTPMQLIIRNLSRFISVVSGISDDERAVHDIASNTFVIKNVKLKKIELKKPLILIFNLSMAVFWIYFIGIASNKLSALDITLLIVLILSVIYALISLIRSEKVSNKAKD